MKRVVIIVIIVIAVVGTGLAGWRYAAAAPETTAQWLESLGLQETEPEGTLQVSGAIEAEIVEVGSEVGGRVVAIEALEGHEVAAGATLVRLDTSLIDAEIERARAAVAAAEAGVALVSAGAQPEAVAQAEALLQQTETAAEAAQQAWTDAQAIRDAPQQEEVELAAAQSEAQLAEGQIEVAQLMAQSADLEQAMYERLNESLAQGIDVQVPTVLGPRNMNVDPGPAAKSEASIQWNVASQRTWQAYAGLNEAQAARDASLVAVRELQRQLAQPLALEAQANAAEATYKEAEAAIAIARAAVEDVKAGARPEDVAVAQAAVEEARAGLAALEAQRDKMLLRAPAGGLVLERIVSVGEIIPPGTAALRIADLDRIRLTVYVPQADVGRLRLGQIVQVQVDSFPGESFEGTVRHIATEAEFTPKSLPTEEDRATLVFAVQVDMPNSEHRLKPGMPADAVIELAGAE